MLWVHLSNPSHRGIFLISGMFVLNFFDTLTFTTLWASAHDKGVVFFLFFPENRLWNFMQIVFNNLHEMSKPVFWENVRKFFRNGEIKKNIPAYLFH